MKNVVIVIMSIMLLSSIIAGFIATDNAYDAGYAAGSPIVYKPFPSLEISKPPMSDEERLQRLLERFMDNIDTANMTIEFDNSGYARGFISIYYNRRSDHILWVTPEPSDNFTIEYKGLYRDK